MFKKGVSIPCMHLKCAFLIYLNANSLEKKIAYIFSTNNYRFMHTNIDQNIINQNINIRIYIKLYKFNLYN